MFFLSSVHGSEAQKYLEWKEVAPVKVKPGGKAEAIVSLRVQEGFHVQSNPARSPQIPTTLSLEESEGILPGKVVYPKGKPYRLQSSANELSVYEGKFNLRVPLSADSSLPSGKRTLKGKLRYQACNEKTCFFPITTEVTVPVIVEK